jgi:hypothetical protein
MTTGRSDAVRDRESVRRLLEDVYVRDMYTKESREAFSREFDDCFHMLVPELDGRSVEAVSLHWCGLDELRANHPKAMTPGTRFEFPFIDVMGDAAVARVDVLRGRERIYTDYVSIYRVLGGWRVVSKVFHAHVTAGA